MVCNSFRNWSFWCCKFTSFNYSISCQLITFWSLNFFNDVFVTQDVLNSEFTISIWLKLTNGILVSCTDNLEFRTFQWSTVFVYFFHLNAKFVTDTFTTSDLDVYFTIWRVLIFVSTFDCRCILNLFAVNSFIVSNCFIFYCKVIVSRNIPKVDRECCISSIYCIVSSNVLFICKRPFTTTIYPSTFEDFETASFVGNPCWCYWIWKDCIVDCFVSSVYRDTESKVFVISIIPPRFDDCVTFTFTNCCTCYFTVEFYITVNRNLNRNFTIIWEFIFVNTSVEEEWTWNVIFRLSEICECQDNLTSFCINFCIGNLFTSDCIVDFKILRLDIDWSIDSDFSCIPCFNIFSF